MKIVPGSHMECPSNFDMKVRRWVVYFLAISILFILWKLTIIQTDVEKLQFLKDTLYLNKEQLQLSHQQLILIEHLYQAKLGKEQPMIYAITPTYSRYVQKAELTRISQTLALVPNVHWILVEDSDEKTDLVRNLVADSNLLVTHLSIKTPVYEKLGDEDPRWLKHRGVEQRNLALKWLRENLQHGKDKGVVYFMDDDNTYSVKLFKEIAKVKKVGVWPVGLVGGLNAETLILDPNTGKVTGYRSGWKADRKFAIDMAGFAINLDLILAKSQAAFSYRMEKGFQESEFLSYFTTKEELEPLADNCTKVYVWHTRTEKPNVKGVVPGLEV
ncbi:galactosylgalactosylxylosylprotein 3-beta-glucuronosyltransferase I [Photinus pyralis]|nr:galactosylgalactosylxylosylprotein 3-beta-glucuronosyltransferase I [Photinus pyralis]